MMKGNKKGFFLYKCIILFGKNRIVEWVHRKGVNCLWILWIHYKLLVSHTYIIWINFNKNSIMSKISSILFAICFFVHIWWKRVYIHFSFAVSLVHLIFCMFMDYRKMKSGKMTHLVRTNYDFSKFPLFQVCHQ